MNRDKLFLLKADFLDQGEKYYCPECAQLEGVLAFYPVLREKLEIRYVDFSRPRPEVIREIGEANQSCPVLVLASPDWKKCKNISVGDANGKTFISGAEEIGNYLAQAYGIGKPH
jgi:hypothetical protein